MKSNGFNLTDHFKLLRSVFDMIDTIKIQNDLKRIVNVSENNKLSITKEKLCVVSLDKK